MGRRFWWKREKEKEIKLKFSVFWLERSWEKNIGLFCLTMHILLFCCVDGCFRRRVLRLISFVAIITTIRKKGGFFREKKKQRAAWTKSCKKWGGEKGCYYLLFSPKNKTLQHILIYFSLLAFCVSLFCSERSQQGKLYIFVFLWNWWWCWCCCGSGFASLFFC